MGAYRPVYINFWSDTKIVDDFTTDDKLFMLYLLTNPYTNLVGCYEIALRQIALDTGFSVEEVKELLKKQTDIHKMIEYDFDTKEVFVKNWYKYNWTNSTKLEQGIINGIKKVKSNVFRNKLIQIYNKTNTLSIPYVESGDNKSKYKQYGKYKRVFLTDDEYNDLIREYSKDLIDKQIEKLDSYVEGNNNKYNYTNFNLVLRRSITEKWFLKDTKEVKQAPEWLNKEFIPLEPTTEEEIELAKTVKDSLAKFKGE